MRRSWNHSLDAELVGERAQPAAGGGQDDVADAQPAELAGDVVAIAGGRLGEPGAEGARTRCRRGPSRPVSASMRLSSPTSGQLVLARIADLDDQHAVALGDGAQLRQPVERAAEVRDQDDEPAGRRPVGDEAERRLGRLEAAPRGRRPRARRRPASSSRPARPAIGRDWRSVGPPKVSTPSRLPRCVDRWPIGDRDALGDVRLAAVGGAEGHRRRDVEQQPRGQRALRDVDPDVGCGHPGGRVPVDAPDVVAGLVRPDLGELRAAAEVAWRGTRRRRGRGCGARSTGRARAGAPPAWRRVPVAAGVRTRGARAVMPSAPP